MPDIKIVAKYQCPQGHTEFYFGYGKLPKWLRCGRCSGTMKQEGKVSTDIKQGTPTRLARE